MTLKQLVIKAKTKEKFITIQNYIDFAKEYLEFIDNESNFQATIIAQNENHYKFFQYKKMVHLILQDQLIQI
jgi:hypothetical protein